jgi:hypothetical protein
MAPKTNPSPQLNQLISNVKRVIINALLALLEQTVSSLFISLSIKGVKAKTCPSKSINIIWIAKASPSLFQSPLYQ